MCAVPFIYIYVELGGCCTLRIHEAVSEGVKVIDVDSTYLYKKHQRLALSGANVAPLTHPIPPLSGWESVTETNVKVLAKEVPRVTSGIYFLLKNSTTLCHSLIIILKRIMKHI